MTVETVEFHHVAGLTFLVRYPLQIEIGALVLPMARRTSEAARNRFVRRKGEALRARRAGYWRVGRHLGHPHGAEPQRLGGSAVSVERRLRHLVARDACLAVRQAVVGNETANPAQPPVATTGMAGAAGLDRAMRARERSRHQKFRALGENEGRAEHHDGDQPKLHGEQVASPCRGYPPPIFLMCSFRLPPPHHRAPDEKA